MTKLPERYPDLLDAHAPPDRLRLVGDLDTALVHSTLPAHLRASMDGVVRAHMATARRTAPTRRSARAAPRAVLIATGCAHLSSRVQSMPHPLSKRAIASWQMRLCLASLVAALLTMIVGATLDHVGAAVRDPGERETAGRATPGGGPVPAGSPDRP